ncbi:glycosyltransferase family 4 protein [Amylibacter sp.]|nr:glycosyltransferase family 4 protein [Amylibacter sp.]
MNIIVSCSYAKSLLNFRYELLLSLVHYYKNVYVIAPDFTSNDKAKLEGIGVNCIEADFDRNRVNLFRDIKYLFFLIRVLRKIKPHLIITYTIKPNIWGGIAAGFLNFRSIAILTGLGIFFTENEYQSIKYKIIRTLIHFLYRISTSFNSAVIFQNPDDKSDFISSGCLSNVRKAITVNGSGVNLKKFHPTPLPSTPIFLMISRLIKSKGVREFCLASSLVKKVHPNARFVLVGPEDSSSDSFPTEMIKILSDNVVEYLGEQEDVRDEIGKSSTIVLPSYREGTPRCILEGMAMGRAVITTNAPGCKETVKHGLNGFKVPPRDFEMLSEYMIEMVESPVLVKKMGSESLKLVKKRYDVNKVNKDYLKIIKNAV